MERSGVPSLIQDSHAYERGGTQQEEYSIQEVVTVPCPMCGSDARTRIYTEHGAVGVSRCLSCSLIYTSPRIKSPEQVYWGDAAKYYTEARLIFEGRAPHHRDPNYLQELQLIERYKSPGRLLDVGCNMGMLLRLASQRGWTPVGVEPSPSLARLATEHLGLDVFNCFVDELPESELASFDVIALSDVLEHICDPLTFLTDVTRFLSDNGIIYIKVPNARWNLFKQKALGSVGRAPKLGVWDSYEHVVHYTDTTLTRLLGTVDLHPFRITTGKPIQAPIWHQLVGHYYLHPSPWFLDWKRYAGRSLFYWLSWPERLLRRGSIGYFAPNIVAVAKKA